MNTAAQWTYKHLVVSSILALALVGCDGGDSPDPGGDTRDTVDDSAMNDTSEDARDTTESNDASDAEGTEDTDGSEDGGDTDDVRDNADTENDGRVDAAGDAGGLPDGPSSERLARVEKASNSAPPNGYWEYLPPGYGDGEPRPLLVFWHGLGENGDGNGQLDRVLRVGPPRLVNADEWASDRPFVVLSPQHSNGGCPGADEIDAFFDYAVQNYDIDTDRIYLTGLSCGAIGSWNYLGKYTDERVAAAVLIAGDGRGAFNRAGCDLGLVAIWGFHGDSDGTVSPQGTIQPVDELLNCASPPRREIKKTIYEGVGHNSWRRTYDLSDEHDIYGWLLGFE